MKKILILFLAAITVLTVSCEDGEKSPLVVESEAPFVKWVPTNLQIDLSDPNSALTGTFFTDVPDVVVSHEIQVALIQTGIQPTFVTFDTITSFPTDFSLNLGELAAVLGVDLASITPGDQIQLLGRSTSVDGTVIASAQTIDNGDGETGTSNQQPGYRINGVVICPPFEISELAGTYNVTANGLAGGLGIADPDPVREVIAGPGDNQITIVGGSVGFAGGEDLIVDVDTVTGTLSLGLNPSGNPGLAFPATIVGFPSDYAPFADGALAISCIDNPTLNMPLTLTCCNGVFTLSLQRQP